MPIPDVIAADEPGTLNSHFEIRRRLTGREFRLGARPVGLDFTSLDTHLCVGAMRNTFKLL